MKKGPTVILSCKGCEFYERVSIDIHFCNTLKSGEKRKLDLINYFVMPDLQCPYSPKITERYGIRIRGTAKKHK